MVKRLWTEILKIIHFINVDIWRISLGELPRIKSFALKLLRTMLLAMRGFNQDRCLLRASSLTFYSLLSIVPVAAMAFGIAKGFGFENNLEKLLYDRLPGQETVITQVVNFARALLETTKGGMIAGFGVILLLWSVINLLGQIENSFNDIWEIRKSRTFGTKLIYYIFVMVVGPIFVVVSSSLTVFVITRIVHITETISLLGAFSPIILGVLKSLPYGLIAVLLTILYIFMPNTKVNLGAGLFAGIVAGITYVIIQWAYINFQIGIAKYNAIYGSFAALPLFLIWLQISWYIVLFGAELSFAIQNVDTYEFERDLEKISPNFKRLTTLQIVHLIIRTFSSGDKPLTPNRISHMLGIPIRLVHHLIFDLVNANIVSAVEYNDSKEKAYQPARDTNTLTIKYVLDALDQAGEDNIPLPQTDELKILSEALQTFGKTIEDSPANRLLKDI